MPGAGTPTRPCGQPCVPDRQVELPQARRGIARCRKLFDGPLIPSHGFGRESGHAIDATGIAGAASFARLFIAHPGLVSQFALGHGLATSDPRTHSRGGVSGYTDYPIWAGP